VPRKKVDPKWGKRKKSFSGPRGAGVNKKSVHKIHKKGEGENRATKKDLTKNWCGFDGGEGEVTEKTKKKTNKKKKHHTWRPPPPPVIKPTNERHRNQKQSPQKFGKRRNWERYKVPPPREERQRVLGWGPKTKAKPHPQPKRWQGGHRKMGLARQSVGPVIKQKRGEGGGPSR